MITKKLGGERLGSGNKMKVSMHGYERANFNLSKNWRSSMSVGTLIPFYCNVGLNGDTFDIDLDAKVKTIPTIGPVFGTFQLQLDIFTIPLRLYNAKLHNNPVNVGLKMQEIPFQKLHIYHNLSTDKYRNYDTCQINESSLLHYLGLSGLGFNSEGLTISREINATPILAYYDIFKNYYSNKQERNAYYIGVTDNQENSALNSVYGYYDYNYGTQGNTFYPSEGNSGTEIVINTNTVWTYEIKGNAIDTSTVYLNGTSIASAEAADYVEVILNTPEKIIIKFTTAGAAALTTNGKTTITTTGQATERNIELKSFELKTLDDVRECILGSLTLEKAGFGGQENYICDFWGKPLGTTTMPWDFSKLPNFTGHEAPIDEPNPSIYDMFGLLVKTYNSDVFNNWLSDTNIQYISGVLGVTKIDTTQGLDLDILNLNQKIYNMLNRVAASDGTYESWQEVTYGQEVIKKAETPIYCGGCTYHIGFEDVVQTGQTTNDANLGTLAGKGGIYGAETNHIVIHIEEPSLIMGIASITPNIDYYQGNKWYLTELMNYGDLHMPELDEIGFQDLLQERQAWFGTGIQDVGGVDTLIKYKTGSTPAWIDYQTDVDEVHGDFANNKKAGYMVVKRIYDMMDDPSSTTSATAYNGIILDNTTYIDPAKFNYMFADQSLNAQNFWVQIGIKNIARRKMSANIIPNL